MWILYIVKSVSLSSLTDRSFFFPEFIDFGIQKRKYSDQIGLGPVVQN